MKWFPRSHLEILADLSLTFSNAKKKMKFVKAKHTLSRQECTIILAYYL